MVKKDKVKGANSESRKTIKWLFIAAFITAITGVAINYSIKPFMDWGTKKYILNELQYGRNQLHLSLVSAELNHHRKINVEFPYRSKVSDVSSYNSENGLKISQMYQAFDNGIKEANRLYDEMRKDPQDKELISNLKSSIMRSLDVLDQLGPSVADFLGGPWSIPSKELSPQELVNNLETVIKTSSATGPTSTTVNIFKK